MRRSRSLVGLIAAALLLTACSGGSAGPGGSGGKYRIGVSFYSNVIPLYVEMRKGMKEKADELGAVLEFAVADNNAEKQANQINTFVTTGVDLILASPVDASALAPAYRDARAAGIPVISVANKLRDESVEDAYIGPDMVEWARLTMERIAEGMGGKGRLLQVTGPPQIAFVQAQKAGWARALAGHPGIEVVATVVVPDLSTSGALDAAASALAANPDVSGIVASNDDMALGAIQATQAAGIAVQNVFVAGWDGSKPALEAIRAGTYDLTLSARAHTWGALAVGTAVAWLNGDKPSGHRVDTPYVFVDAKNVGTLTEEQLH